MPSITLTFAFVEAIFVNWKNLSYERFIARWNYLLDHQNLAIFCHGAVTIFQNSDCTFIIPVVQYVPKYVRIATARHRLKEISSN